jgi:protein-S-isoprenylcysteine O-methyltransferase Ste14
MFAMWAAWFSMCPVDPVKMALPGPVRWLGMALFILGLALALASFAQLRGLENIDHLVTGGLYKMVRHPMYLGFIMWIVGWPVFHNAGLSLALGLPALVSVLYWRSLEEKAMVDQFGDAYLEYRRGTIW